MPYKIEGKKVVKADTGKVVGHSKNPKAYLAVLNMVEHGKKPKSKSYKKMSKDAKKEGVNRILKRMRGNPGRGLRGACGGKRKRDGSGMGVGNYFKKDNS